MRAFLALAVLILVPVCAQSAVVVVDLVSQQEEYLPNEELVVGVRIANQSGRTLHFGRDNAWLMFDVQALDSKHVGIMQEMPVKGEFKIESPMRAVRPFNIAPYFDMTRSGRYFVTATVEIREPGWWETVQSNSLKIDIVRGATVWQREFGVIGANASDGSPEIRRYTLQKVNLMNNRMKMYLRVSSEDETKVYKVRPIDYMMSFSRKELRLDKYNNLHILLQTPRAIARDYNYSVFGADGRLILRQTHNADFSRPALSSDNQGLVRVKGGQRRYARSDVPQISPKEKQPAAKPEPEENSAKGEPKKLTSKAGD